MDRPNYGDTVPEEVADRIGRRVAEYVRKRDQCDDERKAS